MHAVGMMNDHLVDCFRYREIRRLDSVIERAVTGCRLPSLAAERLVLIHALVLSGLVNFRAVGQRPIIGRIGVSWDYFRLAYSAGAVKNDPDIVVWASLTKQ